MVYKKHKNLFVIVLLSLCITQYGQSQTTVQEQLYQNTIKISGNGNGDTYVGTASFIRFNDVIDSIDIDVILLNKHLAEKLETVTLSFNTVNKNQEVVYGDVVSFEIKDFKNKCLFHPDGVDLAIFPMSEILKVANDNNTAIFYRAVDDSYIPNDSIWNSLTIMEDIVMIGYPVGLSDTYNNVPIARVGVTATMPKLNFEGNDDFLIDIPIFKGSSGSPVYLFRDPYSYAGSRNGLFIGAGPEIYLLGVQYSGFSYNESGIVDRNAILMTGGENESTYINIGKVVKSYKILEFKSIIASIIKANEK